MKNLQSITSLPRSPDQDRHSRMIKYSVAMGIRVVCIALCLFVQGWWLIVFAIGAITLPYFAVVIANAHTTPESAILRPGNIVRSGDDARDDNASAGDSR
jgi:predicted tellurium resistance membrane protein TerC